MKYYLSLLILCTYTYLSVAQNNRLHFDGGNDYVNLNSISGSMQGLSEFTVEFWVKFDLDDNTDYGVFFSANDMNNGNVFLIRVANGNFDPVNDGAIIYINDNGNQYMSGVTPIGDGACHHIAFTYNNGSCKLYVDGQLEANETHTITFNLGDKYSLGQEYDGGSSPLSNFYNGELGEFRIWDVEKTQVEISNLMNSIPGSGSSDLITYYKFEDGVGNTSNIGITTCTNEITGGGNGQLNNFSLSGNTSNYIINTCESSPYLEVVDTQICASPYLSAFGDYYYSSGLYTDTIFSTGQDTIFQLTLDIISESINTNVYENASGTLESLDSISTYQWLNCDDNFSVISGETNQDYTPTNIGSYAVELTYNGCVDTSDCIAVKGIGLTEHEKLISIFPNPSKGHVVVQGLKENSSFTIHVVSQLGNVIKKLNTSQYVLNIELPYPKGYYIIEIIENKTGTIFNYPIVLQ